MAPTTVEIPAIWLQGQACSGCSVSLLNAASPTVRNALLDCLVPGKHLSLLFHMTIMAGQGQPVLKVLKETSAKKKDGYVLVAEGSFPSKDGGAYSTLGEQAGRPIPMVDLAAELASNAMAVVAVGTCAAFGGIPAGAPDVTGTRSIGAVMKEKAVRKPLINIPGCPPHPDWFLGTVVHVMLRGLPGPNDVDELGRPLVFYGKLIHETCPRRPDFDAARFAKKFGDQGCLLKIGCRGPYTYADCPTRMWNHGVNWCVGNGAPCNGCVEPEFPDKFSPLFQKLTEERLERFAIKR